MKNLIKKHLKLMFFTFFFIFMIGATGLIIQLIDFSKDYTHAKSKVSNLQTKLDKLTYKLFENEAQLSEYDLLKFKSFSLTHKYPQFSNIVEAVYSKGKEFNVDPSLILGIIQVESNFNPTAISNAGAYGLMQINKNVWEKELSINNNAIFDIDYNIDLGLKILKRYLKVSNGDLRRALHLYNNGYKYNNTKYPSLVINTSFVKSQDSSFNLSIK